MVWDEDQPPGSVPLNLGDDKIRENNQQLTVSIGEQHDFNQTPGTQSGWHKFPDGAKAVMDAETDMVSGSIFIRTDSPNPGIHGYLSSAWQQIATLIPASTAMVFHQNAAPDGWDFDSSKNDKVLMVSSTEADGGTDLAGSTWTISAIIPSGATDGHVLTVAELAPHTHDIDSGITYSASGTYLLRCISDLQTNPWAKSTGSGDAHTHDLTFVDTWRPAATQVIVCTKAAVTD